MVDVIAQVIMVRYFDEKWENPDFSYLEVIRSDKYELVYKLAG